MAMADAYRETSWDHTATLLTLLYNKDIEKGHKQVKDFHPYYPKAQPHRASDNEELTMVPLEIFKEIYPPKEEPPT